MTDLDEYEEANRLAAQQAERSKALWIWCQECESRGGPSEYHRGSMLAMLCVKNKFEHNTYIWMMVALEWYPADQFFDDDGNALI